MSQHHRQADSNVAATSITPSEAEQVRCSPDRAQRLNDYLQGILPPHISTTVDVVVTPAVQTAAVLPATAEALLDADGTELSPEQARHLVEQIDGEYLVLVTAQPVPTDRLPVNDQLTADRAHQFGLGFHELLHILKTAVSGVASLLQDEVDDEYHDLVHDLVNTIEDGAIEGEAIEGDNFSDNAAVRLGITRRIHSPTPEEVDPDDPHEATFWDAVTAALYEYAIYPTGIVDALTDPDDSRLVFTSEADRKAFDAVDAELERLAEEALQIRSSEPDDVSHTHDKEASIKRAKRVLETWETVLKPVIDDEARDQQRQQPPSPPQSSPNDGGEQGDEGSSTPRPEAGEQDQSQAPVPGQSADSESSATACPECEEDFDSEHGLRTHYGKQHGDTEGLDAARGEQADDSAETEGGSDGDPAATDAGAPDTDSATGDGAGEEPGEVVPADSPEDADGVAPLAALDVDPEDITTDREASDDPFQDVLDHPHVDEHSDPDPGNVDLDPADYGPDPANGTSSEAGEPDTPDASDPAPSHGGASRITDGEDGSSADAGDSQSTAPADPDPTAADSKQAAANSSNPTGDGEPVSDKGETPAQGRDADEAGSRADPPATGQANASDGDDNTGASSSAGEAERRGDGEEALRCRPTRWRKRHGRRRSRQTVRTRVVAIRRVRRTRATSQCTPIPATHRTVTPSVPWAISRPTALPGVVLRHQTTRRVPTQTCRMSHATQQDAKTCRKVTLQTRLGIPVRRRTGRLVPEPLPQVPMTKRPRAAQPEVVQTALYRMATSLPRRQRKPRQPEMQ